MKGSIAWLSTTMDRPDGDTRKSERNSEMEIQSIVMARI
jgi:hypothetical protein